MRGGSARVQRVPPQPARLLRRPPRERGSSPQELGAARRMGTAWAEDVWKLLGKAGSAGGGRPRDGVGGMG